MKIMLVSPTELGFGLSLAIMSKKWPFPSLPVDRLTATDCNAAAHANLYNCDIMAFLER